MVCLIQYVTFNHLISRLQQLGYHPTSEFKVMTPLQWECEINGLSVKQAVHRVNGQLVIHQLPHGCVVRRGIEVLPEDHVSLNDKIISFRCHDGQNYSVPINTLVNDLDQFDPDA